ncbi:MAG: flagellar motor switch protein FliM [Proteobacteria bacterium]|nr:flagellar motor switch protein FliM [Pseudomonadota bacterium]MBU1232267.1 flagellar motor switch protein FliM [Pseudomonadota bacterium]MBU1416948.1 flagellar motor switch protein FliM [Pseudomonadota bacterium]MBU1456679.1 flagellar motor switch protein FliM [Pseudomonadota bacterium]
MEPILKKEEIAELLAAIKSGQVSTDLKGDDKRFSDVNVSPLNLFQMTGSSDEQHRIPNLDIILDAFAQNFSITLTNQLQRTFKITRTEINSIEFQDYLMSQKDAGAISVLNLEPLKNGALMVLDSELCFSLIEIMLGASTELAPIQLDRKPTTIELNVLKSIMTKACSDIDKALAQVIKIESSIVKIESNSRLVSIAEPDADVLVGRFKIKVGGLSGIFDIVFPTATLDPVRDQLRDLLTIKTVRQSGWQHLLIAKLKDMSTTVIAQSGTITLPVQKIMNFKKGDIINIDYDPNAPLKILVEDNLKFFAIPGTISGKKAIHLTGVYDPGE